MHWSDLTHAKTVARDSSVFVCIYYTVDIDFQGNFTGGPFIVMLLFLILFHMRYIAW